MMQQTALQTTSSVTSSRITGPLVSSTTDPYSMTVETLGGQERVTVPGVLLSDPEFAGGYDAGRALYADEVHEFVDQAGNIVNCIPVSQIPFVKSVKMRDVTDQNVTNFIAETMFADDGEPIPLAWKTGLIFGYVHACVFQAQTGWGEASHVQSMTGYQGNLLKSSENVPGDPRDTHDLCPEGILGLHEAEDFPHNVTCETAHHRIEVHESCLTIGENRFPDHCISLSPEETDQVLEALLVAQSGTLPFPCQGSGEEV